SPATAQKLNPEQGLAALKAVERDADDPALQLLKELQGYVIFTPTTSVLRGIAVETQPRKPVGLSGGQLSDGVRELILAKARPHAARIARDLFELIDWATSYGSAESAEGPPLPLSPSAAASRSIVTFHDRFMEEG